MNWTGKTEFHTRMDLRQEKAGNAQFRGGSFLFELIVTVGLSVGCWFTYFSMFPSPLDPVIHILLIGVIPIGLYFLCWNPVLGRFLVVYVFLLAAVFFLLAYESVWNGLLVMGNIVIEIVNEQLGAGWIPFHVTGDTVDWSRDVFLAVIPVILLVSMGIAHSVYYKEPVLGFVLTAIPVLLGICLKMEPSPWLLALLLISWIELLVLSAVSKTDAGKKKKRIHIASEKTSSLPFLFLGIVTVLLTGYILLFSGEDYRPPERVDEVKDAVIAAEEYLRYENLCGEETAPLAFGDLSRTDMFSYTENTVFSLRMQMPQPMYLRGFTGGSFENGRWIEAQQGAYSGEYTGITEWLAQQGFYPWMQRERLYRMSENYDFVTVDVENINGNSKYLYLPYEAAMAGDTLPERTDYRKDYGAFTKGLRGQRSYSFTVFLSDFTDYDEAGLAKWLREVKQHPDWEEYAETEAIYRRYVYDTYLYVPDKEANAIGTSGIETCAGKTVDYTLHYIRKLFDEEFRYDTAQAPAPEGRDELEWFMEESRCGNDMHFATAATLMFRKAGIPARYAEGYYLSPEYMQIYEQMSGVRLDIPDSMAHCWVELYIDEIGWFPVEVVPGFYDMERQLSSETEKQERLDEQTQKNYEDEAPEENQQKEPSGSKEKDGSLWRFVLPLLLFLALIGLFEWAGRKRLRKRWRNFESVYTDAQVYGMYRYAGKLAAFDGKEFPLDPYERKEEFSRIYDSEDGLSFEAFLRLVYRVRFGGQTLTEDEHRRMAEYVKAMSRSVYDRQPRIKKFLMKFIFFYI